MGACLSECGRQLCRRLDVRDAPDSSDRCRVLRLRSRVIAAAAAHSVMHSPIAAPARAGAGAGAHSVMHSPIAAPARAGAGEKPRRACDHCEFFDGTDALVEAAPAVWDIEELVALSRARGGGCPYYAARALAGRAGLVFAPCVRAPRVRPCASRDRVQVPVPRGPAGVRGAL